MISLFNDNLIVNKIEDINKIENIPTFTDYINNPELVEISAIDLHPDMFKFLLKKNKEFYNYIMNKYFFYVSHSLDRFCPLNITNEEYKKALSRMYKQPQNASDMELETASLYWKRKVIAYIVKSDFGTNVKVNLNGVSFSEESYEYYDFEDNQDWLENRYRENEDEKPIELRTRSFDISLWKIIYRFLIKSIKHRLVMIFQLDSFVFELYDILQYSLRDNGNITKEMSDSLESMYNKIAKITSGDAVDKDGKPKDKYMYDLLNWINEGNNDYTLYANGDTLSDYIATYHKIINKLNDYPEKGILKSYLKTIHYTKDKFEKHFIEDDIDDILREQIEKLNAKKIKISTDDISYYYVDDETEI